MNQPHKHRRRSGLTLLELLAALVLASVMMAGVVGVLKSMNLKARQVAELDVKPDWHRRFVALITHDLRNARRINVDETSITLTGYMGRDFGSGQATHRPTQVRYFIRQTDEHAWLLRREEHIDIRSTENNETEVVCHDVRALTIERLEEGTLRLTQRLRQPTSQTFVTVPARLRISLFHQPTPDPKTFPELATDIFLR